MKATALAIGLVAALSLAPTAAAKGLPLDRVCGASGCVAFAEDDLMVTLYVGAVQPEPPTLPYYRLYHRGPGAAALRFVPGKNLAGPMPRGGRRWFSLNPTENGVKAIQAAIPGLAPFPAPESWTIHTRDQSESPASSSTVALLLFALAAGAALALRYRNHRVSSGVEAT
jgi:hypothetical protein